LFEFLYYREMRYFLQSRYSPMTQPDSRGVRRLRDASLIQREPENMLDVLLALDRMLVEVSMRLYKVPHNDRAAMRKQNRRLHSAVREHLPRLLKPSRRRS
jgi:hypothetical protein